MVHLLPLPNAHAVNSLGCTTTSFIHHEIARPTRSSSFQRKPLHRGLDYTVNNIKHKQKQAQNQLLRASVSPGGRHRVQRSVPLLGVSRGQFSVAGRANSSQLRVYSCMRILRTRARAGTTSTGKSMLLENPQNCRLAVWSAARRQRQ